MKCNQLRPGFELASADPFPATITMTSRALLVEFIVAVIRPSVVLSGAPETLDNHLVPSG